MCPRQQQDPVCPMCSQPVPAGVPVIFHQGETLHLDCYVASEGLAALIWSFIERRPREGFCYSCRARHLTRDRQEVEKAATALRASQRVVVEAAVCSRCAEPRVTIQAKPVKN